MRGGAPEANDTAATAITAVGSFATGLAHEINNPLAVVRTNVEEAVRMAGDIIEQLPKASRAEIAELTTMLEETLAAAQRIESLVRDLRPFASPEDRRTRVDIAALIESACAIAFAEIRHRARLKKELAPDLRVVGSEIMLGQAIFNLLLNAAQAMTDAEMERNEILVRSRAEGDRAIIDVIDTGRGIDDIEKAFAPRYSTRGRPGMGLPVVRAAVLAHSGTVEALPNEGGGTIVRITLPRDP